MSQFNADSRSAANPYLQERVHGAQSYTPMNERLRRSTDENNSALSNSMKGSVTEIKQDLGASQLSS